ncbi:MAG: SAM-dependent methyltransferase [Gammaproteobacteria bacterium]
MTHSNANVASLVSDNLALLQELEMENGVLDLASGNGRNGLFLVEHHIPVIFADNNESALREIESEKDKRSAEQGSLIRTWQVDLEIPESQPLAGKIFDSILVFNYLHRPLMQGIREAIRPGGLIMYETFTTEQAQFGKPSNPDFLLAAGELREYFQGWEILHYREGKNSNPRQARASLIARKPEDH